MGFDPKKGFRKGSPTRLLAKTIFSYLTWLTLKMAFRLRRCGPIILMSKYLTGLKQTDRTLWINFGRIEYQPKKIIFVSWLVDPETGQRSHFVSWSQIPFWTLGSTSAVYRSGSTRSVIIYSTTIPRPNILFITTRHWIVSGWRRSAKVCLIDLVHGYGAMKLFTTQYMTYSCATVVSAHATKPDIWNRDQWPSRTARISAVTIVVPRFPLRDARRVEAQWPTRSQRPEVKAESSERQVHQRQRSWRTQLNKRWLRKIPRLAQTR